MATAATSQTNRRPDSANAASRPSALVEYATMPRADSRIRSRRRNSAAGTCSGRPASSSRGSASNCSSPVARLSDHSPVTGSSAASDRRKSTRPGADAGRGACRAETGGCARISAAGRRPRRCVGSRPTLSCGLLMPRDLTPAYLSSCCTSRNWGCRESRSHSKSTISEVTISAPCCLARSIASALSAGSREPIASATTTTRWPPPAGRARSAARRRAPRTPRR